MWKGQRCPSLTERTAKDGWRKELLAGTECSSVIGIDHNTLRTRLRLGKCLASNILTTRLCRLKLCPPNGCCKYPRGPHARHIRPRSVGDSDGEAWRRIICRTFPQASCTMWTRIGSFRLLLDPPVMTHPTSIWSMDPSSWVWSHLCHLSQLFLDTGSIEDLQTGWFLDIGVFKGC